MASLSIESLLLHSEMQKSIKTINYTTICVGLDMVAALLWIKYEMAFGSKVVFPWLYQQ